MERVLPIAEVFESIQGEGQWVGTPMLFVRLAGCNVGKPAKALKVDTPFPMLQTGKEAMACCTYDGRIFPCDTDYSLREKVPVEDIITRFKAGGFRHMCVTGGEPFLHGPLLEELFYEVGKLDGLMHVETSGTIKPTSIWYHLICPGYWITCSPKLSALSEMILRADELKILVDSDFDIFKLTDEMLQHNNVFLCPVNGVDDLDHSNVQRCVELLKTYPHWRVSIQTHKLFHWR
jgi:7-carboxy-7-deazaguanine synthase